MKKRTIAQLKIGEIGIISYSSSNTIPIKLQEMGCLPGTKVQLIQYSPFKDLLYLDINGSHFAIRNKTAELIEIEEQ